MDNCFAGIDVSTQSLKIIILDLKDNSVIYNDSVVYDDDLPKYKTINGTVGDKTQGISESDPFMWIDALNIVFKRASQENSLLSNINALSVSGQQHGLVAIDNQGKLTRPTSKLWNDFSTQTECDILTEKIGGIDKMIKEIGNTQRTGYTAPKIFHMYRNEQSFYNETQTFFQQRYSDALLQEKAVLLAGGSFKDWGSLRGNALQKRASEALAEYPAAAAVVLSLSGRLDPFEGNMFKGIATVFLNVAAYGKENMTLFRKSFKIRRFMIDSPDNLEDFQRQEQFLRTVEKGLNEYEDQLVEELKRALSKKQ